MQKKSLWMLVGLLVLAGASIWILIDNANAEYKKMEGKIFGTFYSITYQSSTDFSREILQQLEMVDASLSAFNPQSTVSKINRNESTEADEMFCQVYELANQVSKNTNGAFDITVAPFVNLWGFGFENKENVTPQKIDSLLPLVGYEKVSLQKQHVVKQNPQTMLDFSAIAKGYGVDVVANMLEGRGVQNYIVEIGGEIRAKGVNPQKEEWTMGVVKPQEDPGQQSTELQALFQMPKMAIATSGNYRNFYYRDGKRYAHTINPKTGFPVEHSLLSATVSAPTCAMADAYATAFMVMGLERAKLLLEKNPQLDAYLIYTDSADNYKVFHTKGLTPKE